MQPGRRQNDPKRQLSRGRSFAPIDEGGDEFSGTERTPVISIEVFRARSKAARSEDYSTRVSDVMELTRAWLEPDTLLDDARAVFASTGVGAAAVTDVRGHPLGRLSRTALDRLTRETQTTPGLAPQDSPGLTGFLLDRRDGPTVSDVMERVTQAVGMVTPIWRAGCLMATSGIRRLAVIDDRGMTRGFVSQATVERWLAAALDPRNDAAVSGRLASQANSILNKATDSPLPPKPFCAADQRTILVVEDDQAICDGLLSVLRDEGYTGLRAQNGREALEVLAEVRNLPGLILLDLMMPEMNGWEFRYRQLENESISSIPVVVLTAHGKGAKFSDLNHPAALLRKPISVDALFGAIAAHYRETN
ncbi:MAG: response regulator [Deltaproteobacteria bacterium]|nr:response regulator [Deltaproteobacteria bacterium]